MEGERQFHLERQIIFPAFFDVIGFIFHQFFITLTLTIKWYFRMFQHFFYCILKFSLYYYCQVKLLVTGFGLLTLGAVYKPVQTSNHVHTFALFQRNQRDQQSHGIHIHTNVVTWFLSKTNDSTNISLESIISVW